MRDFSANYHELETRVLGAMRGDLSGGEFSAAAIEVYRFQRKHNGSYDNYCRHLGAAPDLADWKMIPAVPQSAFKQFALRSFPEKLTTKTFRTSGTTGEGFGEHHFLSTRLYDESILRGWDYFKFPRLPQVILVQAPAQAPYSSLSHMMGALRARALNGEQFFCMERWNDERNPNGGIRMAGIDANSPIRHSGFEIHSSFPAPVLLVGTALAFLHWFERGEKIELPPGSFAMETGGYKGSGRMIAKAELYGLFGAHLGLAPDSIFNEYGMTEISSQFYTRGLGRPHEGPPWLRALVINPETGAEAAVGETGVLRIFDPANLGSVMAVETRDLAIRRDEGFELLGRDPAALPRGCSRAADEMFLQGMKEEV